MRHVGLIRWRPSATYSTYAYHSVKLEARNNKARPTAVRRTAETVRQGLPTLLPIIFPEAPHLALFHTDEAFVQTGPFHRTVLPSLFMHETTVV